ncbi:MAG TPA: flagellar basal body P-ring protein FlgI [Burkholderiales bacterium]|nr:flagellar basal body P-ring protein FlgI [Burkholderiales bacterium]
MILATALNLMRKLPLSGTKSRVHAGAPLRRFLPNAAGAFWLGYAVACALALLLGAGTAHAERIKDLVSIQGVRGNALIGYGLVVGLDGSGDQTTQTPFTVQSIINMLSQFGVNLPPGIGTSLQLKNVAAVVVTASLPAFARPGQQIDVTVSSIGNAKSLRGGTLLLMPLKGADGQVYAMAQGNLLVGGVGADSGSNKVQVNHLSVGRITGGATVERPVPTSIGQGDFIQLELNTTDFTTTRRVVDAINNAYPGAAVAVDGRLVQVRAPQGADERVAFLAGVEDLQVRPGETVAKVIVNARTGSVVMNQNVSVDTCAVAHGNLSVVISSEPVISQPSAFSTVGQTVQTERTQIEIRQDKGSLSIIKGVSLGEVVKALNALGTTPQDLLSILQAMKSAGALRAELEII